MEMTFIACEPLVLALINGKRERYDFLESGDILKSGVYGRKYIGSSDTVLINNKPYVQGAIRHFYRDHTTEESIYNLCCRFSIAMQDEVYDTCAEIQREVNRRIQEGVINKGELDLWTNTIQPL